MRHRIAGWLSLLLGVVGCGGGSDRPSFRDVQKGKIPLASEEIEAIEEFLDTVDFGARDLVVGEWDSLHIVDGHVRKVHLLGEFEDVSFVSALGELRDLSLPMAHLADLEALAGLEKLESLNLERAGVESLDGLPCNSLRTLYLSVEDLPSLEPLASCQSLHRLIVNDPPAELLATLPRLPSLRILGLEGTGPGEAGLDCLRTYPDLEELYLEGPGIGHLASMPALPELTKLSLQDAFGIEHLDVPALPSLEHLRGWRLSAERITLPVLPSLKKLELTEGELRRLELPPQPSLETVDLSENELEILHGFGPQPELTGIKLRDNEELASIDPLVGSPKLRSVQVHGTRVGLVPPELEEREVAIMAMGDELEYNAQLQKLIRAYDANAESWAETLPSGSGRIEKKSGGCRTKSSMHGTTEVRCDWRIERLHGTVFLAPVSGDIFESMKHGEPIGVTVTLSVERGTAGVFFREEADLERLAEMLTGHREERPAFSIRIGEPEESETYRSGYRFAEARPGEPAELGGKLHWLAGDAVFWLASIDGAAEGLRVRIEP